MSGQSGNERPVANVMIRGQALCDRMILHPGRHDDRPWRWHVGALGALSSIAGIVAGGCLALLLARVIGIDQSTADYGSAYRITLGGAWVAA